MARKASSVAEWEGAEAKLRQATERIGIMLPDGADAFGVPIQIQQDGGDRKENHAFFGDGKDGTHIGAAVPITKDGYFLTAKHCLGDAPAVFIHDRAKGKLVKSMARVVWTSSDEADLALLRTSHRIDEPFELAGFDQIAKEDRVGATGWSGLVEGGSYDGMAAGRVRSVSVHPPLESDAFGWAEVEHDAPIQGGDSGGPLIDSRGRLVGIHSGGKVGAIAIYQPKPEGAPLRGFRASSHLPDRAWVVRRIEEDKGLRR
jgi:S1-C subfamily serine protease